MARAFARSHTCTVWLREVTVHHHHHQSPHPPSTAGAKWAHKSGHEDPEARRRRKEERRARKKAAAAAGGSGRKSRGSLDGFIVKDGDNEDDDDWAPKPRRRTSAAGSKRSSGAAAAGRPRDVSSDGGWEAGGRRRADASSSDDSGSDTDSSSDDSGDGPSRGAAARRGRRSSSVGASSKASGSSKAAAGKKPGGAGSLGYSEEWCSWAGEGSAIEYQLMADLDQKGAEASCKTVFVCALLDELVAKGHRVLVFSQSRVMLDITQVRGDCCSWCLAQLPLVSDSAFATLLFTTPLRPPHPHELTPTPPPSLPSRPAISPFAASTAPCRRPRRGRPRWSASRRGAAPSPCSC